MIHFLGMEKAVNEMPFFPTKVQECFFIALITKFTKVAVKLRTATFNFSTPPLTIAFLAVELSLSPPRGNFSQNITEGHLLVTYLLLSHSWHGWPFSPSIVTPGWSDMISIALLTPLWPKLTSFHLKMCAFPKTHFYLSSLLSLSSPSSLLVSCGSTGQICGIPHGFSSEDHLGAYNCLIHSSESTEINLKKSHKRCFSSHSQSSRLRFLINLTTLSPLFSKSDPGLSSPVQIQTFLDQALVTSCLEFCNNLSVSVSTLSVQLESKLMTSTI